MAIGKVICVTLSFSIIEQLFCLAHLYSGLDSVMHQEEPGELSRDMASTTVLANTHIAVKFRPTHFCLIGVLAPVRKCKLRHVLDRECVLDKAKNC